MPGDLTDPRGRITKPTRVALLEGMRHKDEWDQLVREMPPLESRVRPHRHAGPPSTCTPLTREVVEAVEPYRRIGEIVDHCSFPDYQVLRTLSELMSRQVVELEKGEEDATPAGADESLYSVAQVRRLREWLASQRPRPAATLKVLISAGDTGALGRFLELMRQTTDFVVDGRLARQPARLSQLATLGHLGLGEGVSLRLVSLPPDPVYQPLWDVAGHGALGAIVVPAPVSGATGADLTDAVAEHLRACGGPVVHAALGEAAPDDAVQLSRSAPRASLQELFARLLAVSDPKHVLKRARVLRDLGHEERVALGESLELRDLCDGEVLFRTGDEATELILVAGGALRLERAGTSLGNLTPGEMVGGAALVAIGQRECDAVAEGEARVLTPVARVLPAHAQRLSERRAGAARGRAARAGQRRARRARADGRRARALTAERSTHIFPASREAGRWLCPRPRHPRAPSAVRHPHRPLPRV